MAARAEIHSLLGRLVREGVAILLVSSDLAEVFALSHRLLVMREGRIVGEFATGTVTPEQVLQRALPDGKELS